MPDPEQRPPVFSETQQPGSQPGVAANSYPSPEEEGTEPEDSFPIVGVGSSAGGLESFSQFLAALSAETNAAFIYIQHLDPHRESMLVEILSRSSQLPVVQAQDGTAVEPGRVYVGPPGAVMTIAGGRLRIDPPSAVGMPREYMIIDVFFRSLAQDQGRRAIGVILSGTGTDGTLGLQDIKEHGGLVLVQEITTARFGGMPQSAIAHCTVDFVLPPREIAQTIIRLAQHPYLAAPPAGDPDRGHDTAPPPPLPGDGLRGIITLLQRTNGVDFAAYKHSTIFRRTTRRMALLGLDDLEAYVSYCLEHADEVTALYHDLLIKVTRFFRDPGSFDALKQSVLPTLFQEWSADRPLRIWVPGCSTGEEAYSLGIILFEWLAEQGLALPKVQIFATDVDEMALAKARTGMYVENIAMDVAPERLQRYFTRVDHSYQISPQVREVCTFARHNLLRDPPFSNIDLISCRNVLMYFDLPAQRHAIANFHYALRPTGFLMLGNAETFGSSTGGAFTLVDGTHKVYAKQAGAGGASNHEVLYGNNWGHATEATQPARPTGGGMGHPAGRFPEETDVQREADRALLGYYAPAGVLVNEHLEILQFRGDASHYLLPSPGWASLNLMSMVREGLITDLSAAIDEARATGGLATRADVSVSFEGALLDVTVRVIPLAAGARYYLLVFEEPGAPSPRRRRRPQRRGAARRLPDDHQLRRELESTRQYLQTANEELRSANEEVLSANEELQSTNEELETAKEELQSSNEELTTGNEELQHRNRELNRRTDDLNNLFNSGDLPMVHLGEDLRIQQFSNAARNVLNIIPTDVGRHITDLRLNVPVPGLEMELRRVLNSGDRVEREVQDREGHWHLLRLRPYRNSDGTISGVVLLLIDIDSVKDVERLTNLLEEQQRATAEARDALDYVQDIFGTMRETFLVLDQDLQVMDANETFYEIFRVDPGETLGRLIYDLGNGQWNIPQLREALNRVISQSEGFIAFEVAHDFPSIGRRVMLLNARLVRRDHLPEPWERILLAIEDITERRQSEERLATSERHYRRLFESARDGILILDYTTGEIVDANPFMETLLGHSRQELVGRNLWESGLFQDNAAALRAFQELKQEGYIRQDHLPLINRKGQPIAVEVVGNVYAENGERVVQYNIRDIRERRQSEEALRASQQELAAELAAVEQLQSLSTQLIQENDVEDLYHRILQVAITLMDSDMASLQLLDEGRNALHLVDWIGFAPQSAAFWEWTGAEAASATACGMALRAGERMSITDVETCDSIIGTPEHDAYRQSGIRAVQSTPLVSRSGRVLGMVSTHWREPHQPVERELRLLDVVARQAADLLERSQNEEALRDADRRKDEFLAMLSHELRNPLAPIAASVQLLRMGQVDEADQQEVISTLARQVGILARLVEDLLEISRVTSGRIDLRVEDVDINALAQRAAQAIQPQLEGRGHQLTVSPAPDPLWIQGDPTRLEQVVVNLLSNAAKYTPREGQVWLEVEPEGDEAVLRVRDSGIGIEPDLLPHVFDLFRQGSSEAEGVHSGLGIGLTLVRTLVELHDGTVIAQSPGPGQGSQFTVRLPAVPAPASAAEADAGTTAPSGRPLRVLLVEDVADTRVIFGRLLQALGHEIRTAHDGVSALEAALEFRPHVVLLDLGLPGMDGYEVAQRMRKEAELRNVVLVALTGYGQETDRQRTQEVGFDRHMVKPPDIDDLERFLAEIGGNLGE